MRFGNFEVRAKPPLSRGVALLLLAPLLLLFLVLGMLNTHWMLSVRHPHRYAALIPSGFDQLKQYPGPVYMHIHVYTSHAVPETTVLFENKNGKVLAGVERFSVPLWEVLAMAKKYAGQPVTTLWMFKANPWVKVWAIDVNGKRALRLDTQVGNFKRGVANGYDWLAMAALLGLGVAFFYFEVDRIPVGR